MGYTPTVWECGDTITDDRMNNIETGIQAALECCGGGGSVRVVRVVDQVTCQDGAKGAESPHPVVDISYQEIVDGLADGTVFCFLFGEDKHTIASYPMNIITYEDENYYQITAVVCEGSNPVALAEMNAFCDTADGNLHVGVNCWLPNHILE